MRMRKSGYGMMADRSWSKIKIGFTFFFTTPNRRQKNHIFSAPRPIAPSRDETAGFPDEFYPQPEVIPFGTNRVPILFLIDRAFPGLWEGVFSRDQREPPGTSGPLRVPVLSSNPS